MAKQFFISQNQYDTNNNHLEYLVLNQQFGEDSLTISRDFVVPLEYRAIAYSGTTVSWPNIVSSGGLTLYIGGPLVSSSGITLYTSGNMPVVNSGIIFYVSGDTRSGTIDFYISGPLENWYTCSGIQIPDEDGIGLFHHRGNYNPENRWETAFFDFAELSGVAIYATNNAVSGVFKNVGGVAYQPPWYNYYGYGRLPVGEYDDELVDDILKQRRNCGDQEADGRGSHVCRSVQFHRGC